MEKSSPLDEPTYRFDFFDGYSEVHPSLNQLTKDSKQFPYKHKNKDGIWVSGCCTTSTQHQNKKLSESKFVYYQSKKYKNNVKNKLGKYKKSKKKRKKKRKKKKKRMDKSH